MMLDDTLREQLAKKLRGIFADLMTTEIPPRFARLLDEPPDDRPPRGAPGQRSTPAYYELAEDVEAAERQVA